MKTLQQLWFMPLYSLLISHHCLVDFWYVVCHNTIFSVINNCYLPQADSILGKFWTILSLSVVYSIGQIVVSVTAIKGVTGNPPHWYGCAIGLLLVGIGTGGIKPCVSSFGGDQFKESQTELLRSFFAIFYFSINIGSTVSTFVTPIFRNKWGYAAAFSLPATLLIIATVIFAIGKRSYRNVPPTGWRNNPYFKVFGVVYHALKNIRNPQYARVRHWVDRAEVKYDRQTVYDVKCVLGVMKVLLPIVIFWSLFDVCNNDRKQSRLTRTYIATCNKICVPGRSYE
jgi:solute carrier family 15 oligopeptide transporter 1